MSIVGQTPERTVRNGLEISVSSPYRVMLMLLLVVVLGPECFVGVARVGNFVVYRVRVNHPSFLLLYLILKIYINYIT